MESVGHINIYNVSSVDILPVDVLIICQGIGEDCPMAVTALLALIMEEVLYNIQVVLWKKSSTTFRLWYSRNLSSFPHTHKGCHHLNTKICQSSYN